LCLLVPQYANQLHTRGFMDTTLSAWVMKPYLAYLDCTA